MARLSLLGISSNLNVYLLARLFGHEVGRDSFGNRYYRVKPRRGQTRDRRIVLYSGVSEASAVPPEWHGWLHHQQPNPPAEANPLRPAWVAPHEPNPTMTAKAYLPDGHTLKGGQRAPATGDYQAWTPEGR